MSHCIHVHTITSGSAGEYLIILIANRTLCLIIHFVEEKARGLMGCQNCVQVTQCVSFWTILLLLYMPAAIWLSLSRVSQSSIACSLDDFYIAGLPITDMSNFNQSIIYIKLHFQNTDEGGNDVYYENLNLTISYYASTGIVQLISYDIDGFHQVDKETDRYAYVVTTQRNSWKDIPKNMTSPSQVVFRVDLVTVVRFRDYISGVKSKKREIMAWAKVEVDPATGKEISKEAIELKHMIEHHISGWSTLASILMKFAALCIFLLFCQSCQVVFLLLVEQAK